MKKVRVKRSARLLRDCPQIINATGIIIQELRETVLVKFEKNYYPAIDEHGEVIKDMKLPRPGFCQFLFNVDEIEVIGEVSKKEITRRKVTRAEIRELFGVSDQTISLWMNNEKYPFPRPINRGYPRKWNLAQIEEWEKKRGWFN